MLKKVFGNFKIYYWQGTRADAGIFLRSRGRGVQEQLKKALKTFILVLNYFTEGLYGLISKKTYIFQDVTVYFPRWQGVQHFPGCPTFFQRGGEQMLIPIQTYKTCDFPGV